MTNLFVRNVESHDFANIMRLEDAIFGSHDEPVLGPYYVRLCCDFFQNCCFVAVAQGEIVGYLLSFVREREAYCTTLAVTPQFQGTRAVPLMLRGFVQAIAHRVDSCWFTVKPDNAAARALHATLGAVEVDTRDDFYGPGDVRIVSRIDQDRFERLRSRYERLGLVQSRPRAVGAEA